MREALQMLSAKGLISIEKGRGIFVTGYSSDTVTNPMHTYLQLKSENNIVIDVIRARMIIEPSIAQYAAVNRDDNDLVIMKQNIEDMKNNLGEGVKHSAPGYGVSYTDSRGFKKLYHATSYSAYT